MKNLPKLVRLKQRGAKSPYSKYSKAPYVYSQAYREWFRANRQGGVSSRRPQG